MGWPTVLHVMTMVAKQLSSTFHVTALTVYKNDRPVRLDDQLLSELAVSEMPTSPAEGFKADVKLLEGNTLVQTALVLTETNLC